MIFFVQKQAQTSAGIGVSSMAMAAPNILDNKALDLPNVKNVGRVQTYSLTTEPAILIVMQIMQSHRRITTQLCLYRWQTSSASQFSVPNTSIVIMQWLLMVCRVTEIDTQWFSW